MPIRKLHKKDLKPKMKDEIGETIHHGRISKDKIKYKHKNHWLEEDDDLPIKVKPKKKREISK